MTTNWIENKREPVKEKKKERKKNEKSRDASGEKSTQPAEAWEMQQKAGRR